MNDKQITIPIEAIQLLINTLVKYPYQEIQPVMQKYSELVSEANKITKPL